jgi:AraC-like DNA-binding protein
MVSQPIDWFLSVIDFTRMKHASAPDSTGTQSDLLVPIATVAGAPSLLADAGTSIASVARAAGLDPDRFDDPTQTIRFAEIGRYLTECVRATRDETFPLRLGFAEALGALTVVGYLAQHSPYVPTALQEVRQHVHHFAGAIAVMDEEGLASLKYRFLLPRIEGAGLIAEAGMGIGVSVLRQLCGPAWDPIEVRLARTLPLRPSDWGRCVQAPVQFGAESNVLMFSAAWLDHRLERANAEFRRLRHERVAALDAEHGEDLALQVRSVIRASLLVGDASIRQIADRLSLSPRTLRRRLSAQQTSFESLLEKTGFEVACHLLENTTASMTQIADLVGYAHSSALSRAFRRWTGLSPRDWRAQRKRAEFRQTAKFVATPWDDAQ